MAYSLPIKINERVIQQEQSVSDVSDGIIAYIMVLDAQENGRKEDDEQCSKSIFMTIINDITSYFHKLLYLKTTISQLYYWTR